MNSTFSYNSKTIQNPTQLLGKHTKRYQYRLDTHSSLIQLRSWEQNSKWRGA